MVTRRRSCAGASSEFSAATRRSLTVLDGRTHVALAAFTQGRPIGIVRIIDLGDARGELAVEVVDWQGCGVGTQLLQAARDRAAAMGYRELARTVRPGLPTDAGAKRRTVDAVALGLGLSEDACAVS
jgi:GNAT superfamily N-acetyltransferase